ncbi:MAG TPA: hypothetical protein VLJ79_27635 [Candidatus Binatia bacterium]|nr:hypothetical protein [Candidatus Binatia bacterium]
MIQLCDELGAKSRPDNLVISDAAVKADQAQTELKIKGPISLDKVHD